MRATQHTSPKELSDDEVMDYVYGKLFNDLDGIESHTLFDEDGEHATEGTAKNAEPESKDSGGVKVTIEPMMHAAHESSKMSSGDDEIEDEEEDRLKGISGMSPMMARLHGER